MAESLSERIAGRAEIRPEEGEEAPTIIIHAEDSSGTAAPADRRSLPQAIADIVLLREAQTDPALILRRISQLEGIAAETPDPQETLRRLAALRRQASQVAQWRWDGTLQALLRMPDTPGAWCDAFHTDGRAWTGRVLRA